MQPEQTVLLTNSRAKGRPASAHLLICVQFVIESFRHALHVVGTSHAIEEGPVGGQGALRAGVAAHRAARLGFSGRFWDVTQLTLTHVTIVYNVNTWREELLCTGPTWLTLLASCSFCHASKPERAPFTSFCTCKVRRVTKRERAAAVPEVLAGRA